MAMTAPRRAAAPLSSAPVVISTSYLDTIKAMAAPGVGPFAGGAHLTRHGGSGSAASHALSATSASGGTAAAARVHAMRALDETKRKEAAERVAAGGADEIAEEERRARVQIRESRVETMSEVQELNHKVAKARVLDTWNRQLQWKARRAEQDRLADVAAAEEAIRADAEACARAAAVAAKRSEGEALACAVIRTQLKERALARELDLEAKELEGEQMVRMAEEAVAVAEAKKAEGEEKARRMRAELDAANKASIARKAARAAEERSAEAEVLRHMIEKDTADRLRAEAERAAKAEKERMWAAVRAKQQREVDRRADEDARMARLEEAVVMRERKREAEAAAARAKLMATVTAERDLQLQLKAKRLEEERAVEEALLRLCMERDMEALRVQAEREAQAKAAKAAYKADMEAELARRAEERRLAPQFKYEERLAMQRDEIRRARALAEATERKIAALKAEGVSDAAIVAAGVAPPLPTAPAPAPRGARSGIKVI